MKNPSQEAVNDSASLLSAKSAYVVTILGGFFVLLFLIIFAWQEFCSVQEHLLTTTFSSFDEGRQPALLLMWFLTIHHIRLWIGINFIINDVSFREAQERYYKKNEIDGRVRSAIETLLRLVLFCTTFLFTEVLAGKFGSSALAFTLCIQSAALLGYNANFFGVMFREDEQKAANMFIAVGDVVVIALAACVLWLTFFPEDFASTLESPTVVLAFLLGGLGVVFVGEIFSQYLTALVATIKDFAAIIMPLLKKMRFR